MRCFLLICVAAGLLQAGAVQAEDDLTQALGVPALKRAFYEAVNRHVEREARENAEQRQDRLALRDDEEEDEAVGERERSETREPGRHHEGMRHEGRHRHGRGHEDEDDDGEEDHGERHHAHHHHHRTAEKHAGHGEHGGCCQHGGCKCCEAAHHEHCKHCGRHAHHGPHDAGFPHPHEGVHGFHGGFFHPHEGVHHPGERPPFMAGPHHRAFGPEHMPPHPQPHVVYVIVTGKHAGLPPWMQHLGPHADGGHAKHHRPMTDEDEEEGDDEDEDEDDEQEEEIEELREQVQLLRREVHVMAEILKELKRAD